MAGGDDEVLLYGVRDLNTIDGGAGTDGLELAGYGDARALSPAASVVVHLVDDFLNVDGDCLAALTAVEDVATDSFVRNVVRGDDGANRIRWASPATSGWLGAEGRTCSWYENEEAVRATPA